MLAIANHRRWHPQTLKLWSAMSTRQLVRGDWTDRNLNHGRIVPARVPERLDE